MLIREIDYGMGPEELFGALCERPHSFFLDSAQAADGLGRFSFIGFDPFLVFRAHGEDVTLSRGGRAERRRGEPLEELRRLLHLHRTPGDATLPFAGGAVGWFSYEFGLRFERIAARDADDWQMPEAEFGFYDGVLAFDADARRAFLVAQPVGGTDEETVARRLEATVRAARTARSALPIAKFDGVQPRSNFTKAEYLRAIARIKGYIRAGDVYQVNLSQRFEASLPCSPYALYRRLRRRSPAPFAGYLNFGGRQVVSSSPERFLRVRDGRAETRPIKGTRPRGRDAAEDAQLARELAASEKDRAELLMIADLARNDLGRVCEFGSIRADELYRLEAHPTVFHLVAVVSGRLAAGRDALDAVRAAFPGGSITGAPKIRAMQLIAEFEPHRRDVYTGAIGYFGFDGNCDFNIAIRTIQCRGGRARYHVGGGIVWDSDPECEYQETLDKGRAMRAALAGDEA